MPTKTPIPDLLDLSLAGLRPLVAGEALRVARVAVTKFVYDEIEAGYDCSKDGLRELNRPQLRVSLDSEGGGAQLRRKWSGGGQKLVMCSKNITGNYLEHIYQKITDDYAPFVFSLQAFGSSLPLFVCPFDMMLSCFTLGFTLLPSLSSLGYNL